MRVEFFVPGIPRPGGSKTPIPVRRKGGELVIWKDKKGNEHPVINMKDSSDNRDWKANVAHEAKIAMAGRPPFDCALVVTIQFLTLRPKSHLTSKGALCKGAPRFWTGQPDTLKLTRSTEDAMTGIVWRDDSANVILHLSKGYANRSGALIIVEPLEDLPVEVV